MGKSIFWLCFKVSVHGLLYPDINWPAVRQSIIAAAACDREGWLLSGVWKQRAREDGVGKTYSPKPDPQ